MKLFVLLSRVPYPLEKGDKLRAFNHIRYLAKFYEIHLFCVNDSDLHPEAKEILSQYCKSVTIVRINKINIYLGLIRALFNGLPLQVGFFYHPFIKRLILAKIAEIKPDHIFCQLIRVAEYVKDLKIPKTLDYQDVFSKGAERMSNQSSFFMKPILQLEAKRVEKYETDIFDFFNNKVIISEPDRDAINHPENNKIIVIPNGVDVDFFSHYSLPKEYDILFSGNMAYPPNINSVEYLIQQVLPELQKIKPGIKILIAGASPDKKVLKLASENVTITGWVENIRDCYAKSKIFVAPMQIGTGLQNKLLEAMAMKLPCVSSGLANNALHASEDTEILIGYSPQDYAAKIINLLDNPQIYQKIAEGGYRFVHENYNWDFQVEKLHKLIEATFGSN
jgi:sugar transferase (PEP-CTERM/EpsH1 system associated)